MSLPELNLQRPIFLLASERSGTNLLRSMLGAHSELAAPTPVHLLATFAPLLPLYDRADPDGMAQRLCADVARFLKFQIGSWTSNPTAEQLLDCLREPSLLGVLDAAYEVERRAIGASRIVIKENDLYRHADRLIMRFEKARFVYLVRDGRDVVASRLRSANHPGGPVEAARLWAEEQQQGLFLLCSPGVAQHVRLVHYEDLVSQPAAVLEDLCGFLDLPYQQGMLAYHEQQDVQRQAAMVKNWENIGLPVRPDSIGRFRQHFSSGRLRRVEAVAGCELKALGYPLVTQARKRRRFLGSATLAVRLITRVLGGARLSPGEMHRRRARLSNLTAIVHDLERDLETRWPRRFTGHREDA